MVRRAPSKLILRTITVELPDFVDLDAHELKLMMAARLYQERKLSLGQAGKLAGVSKRTFIELLGNYDVSVFNQEIEELEDDLENAWDVLIFSFPGFV